jgi:hypothetical protein
MVTAIRVQDQSVMDRCVEAVGETVKERPSTNGAYINAYAFLSRLYTLDTLKHPDIRVRDFHHLEIDSARARFLRVAGMDQLPACAEAVRIPLNGAMTYKPKFFI